jgi:hypothetical protein
MALYGEESLRLTKRKKKKRKKEKEPLLSRESGVPPKPS